MSARMTLANWKLPISALIAGLIFGLGLTISGMSNPMKVLNFLDPFGTWDGSLLFVMVGAIAVATAGYGLLGTMRRRPMFAESFQWPTRKDIDRPLVIGSVLFGLGWGLAGICPGPALTLVHTLSVEILLFGVATMIGMMLAKVARRILADS